MTQDLHPSDRAIRALLRLLPHWLRDADADSVRQSYRDIIDDRRRQGHSSIRIWTWLVLDALRTGMRARWSGPHRHVNQPNPSNHSGRRLQIGPDLRWAVRSLRRTPLWTGTAVLLMSLGIGSNVATFRLLQPVLITPLPYADSAELLWIAGREPSSSQMGAVSAPEFWEYRQATSLSAVVAMSGTSANLTGISTPLRVEGWEVSPGYFEMLGLTPLMGRTFAPDEEPPGTPPVVILSHGLWQSAFGGDPGALGQTITLDERRYTVVGVMPPGFPDLGRRLAPDSGADYWLPLTISPSLFTKTSMGRHGLRVVGRLAPGQSPDAARSELAAALTRVQHQFGLDDEGARQVVVTRLDDQVASAAGPALRALALAVGCLLLLTCVNVTSLLVARSESRLGELQVRAALGASRGGLIRLAVFEALTISLAGGLTGLALALATGNAIHALIPQALPPPGQVDAAVLVFTLVLSLGSGVLAVAAPVFRVLRLHQRSGWAVAGGRGAVGGAQSTLWRGLVLLQIASAVTLVCGASLMLRTMSSLGAVDLGFNPHDLRMVSVNASRTTYNSPERIQALYDAIDERLAAHPAIVSSAASWQTPLQSQMSDWPVKAEGEGREWLSSDPNLVSLGYFKTMGMTMVDGRAFDRSDQLRPDVGVILNETAARQLWPNDRAVGKRVTVDFPTAIWREVIGVVSDVHGRGVAQVPRPQWYTTFGGGPLQGIARLTLLVRTPLSAEDLHRTMTGVFSEVAPDLPLSDLRSMTEQVSGTLAISRMMTTVTTSMGVMALLLAVVGVYGLMTFMIQARRRELGLRMALGASRSSVVRLVFRRAATLGVPGVIVGLAGALAGGRLLTGFLYGVSATDVTTQVVVTVVVLTAIGLAGLGPARRAARIDPLRALSDD